MSPFFHYLDALFTGSLLLQELPFLCSFAGG
jgi:hypothetical protein